MPGTLIEPTDLDALDVRLWLSGVSLAQLYEIFGLTLPESPPYVTEGHLIGRFTAHDKKLRYENFTARVGDSDLSGDFVYETKQPRPLLSGKIDSQSLQFRDLAPLIGASPGARKGADNVSKPADKVLPVEPRCGAAHPQGRYAHRDGQRRAVAATASLPLRLWRH